MSTVQERLKLKRAQIDTWSIREQLCLASSVLRSGDQNWMSVSRSLKAFGDPGRPADWFSQKSCAVQYSNLLENVETPKRKKRTDKGDTSVETPSESIVRRLTQERIEELKRMLNEDRQIYAKLKEEVTLVKTGYADDRLPEMCQEIEEEKRQKERKAEAHERWLKEREEKKVELERAWKPPVAPASPHRKKHHPKIHRRNSSQSEPSSEAESALDSPLSEPLNVDVIGEETVQEVTVEPEPSQTPTSPLLTSLLKSPSPAPTSQATSILHTAITAHRGASPTITSLLSSAPGLPGAANMVTVAPPTTVSSSLKNLVSSAISSEQPHHQPPPHNPSPAAGAPTLSMLLELPPSLPGKPLPELPSAVKTVTLPPSTVTAIVPPALTPTTVAAPPKVVAVKTVTTSVIPTISPKITSSISGSSSNVISSSQEVKVVDRISKEDKTEVLQVDADKNTAEAQPVLVNTKEDLIEEVLIEEVVVNDDSVIESELLTSEISDVVVSTEQEDVKEKSNEVAEEIKSVEPCIAVSQSTELSQKKESEREIVADVDSTSNNLEGAGSAENKIISEEKNSKEECIEDIIETNSQEMVSEIVAEEAADIEMMPPTEAELTSGAVAEVIEITDDQETAIQTEVVDDCGPCMSELEDMEVIILDKVQELDDVHIVEDIKELECEVVEVVMGTQEKVDEEIKAVSGDGEHDALKPEEETHEETCTFVPDTIIECKSTEDGENVGIGKSEISTEEQVEENADAHSEKVENNVIVDNDVPTVEEEEDKPDSASETMISENHFETEDNGETAETILEKTSVEENNELKEDGEVNNDVDDDDSEDNEEDDDDDDDDVEERKLSEDVLQNVAVNIPESPVNTDCSRNIDITETDDKNIEDVKNDEIVRERLSEEIVIEVSEKEEIIEDSTALQKSVEEEEEKQEAILSNNEKDDEFEETAKKDISVKEEFQKDVIKEPQDGEEEEVLKKDDTSNEMSSKKDNLTEESIKKGITDEAEKDIPFQEQVESEPNEKQSMTAEELIEDEAQNVELKVSNKEAPKRDSQRINENNKKVAKESSKKDVEKINIKEKESTKKELNKKETLSPPKEIVKDLSIKETKKDSLSKDRKEVQLVPSKDSKDKDPQEEENLKKPVPSKEALRKDTASKKELLTSKKDLPNSKRDASSKKDIFKGKEVPLKRELLRRDSKEDVTKKEILKRGVTKEEHKDPPREDLRKKSYVKESSKSSRRSEMDNKINDTQKSEPVAKVEKTRRENDTIKEENKEIRREKLVRGTHQKGEEDKAKDELSTKESKAVGNNSKTKILGEEGNKSAAAIEKKEGKEQIKASDKHEPIIKQEPVEHSEEKPERRIHLRSETPSTEDDKTNDAEPPKMIGRKRLAAVNVMDSVPNSPASTTDEEREYKSWKKSIMLLYGRLATHKYASLFLRPITDDQAPGYSSIVHRPIDLLTIKKNIETGVIRTTMEFQRDIMLMFLNSIMYNKSSHLVHKMAKQMQQEGMQHIQDYIATQMLVQVVGDNVPIRRETRTTEANKQRDILGNPSQMLTQDDSESTQLLHKRKRNAASDSSDRGFKKKKMDE